MNFRDTNDSSRFRHARSVLERGVAEGAMPGAVALVFDRDRALAELVAGRAALDVPTAPLTVETIYDLASLTKLFVTSAALVLLERGLICLDDVLSRFLPAFADGEKQGITIRQLLTHTSGLRAWYPLYTAARDTNEVVRLLARLPLSVAPGTRVEYSDLGFVLVGAILERVSSLPLDRLVSESVLSPLGLHDTCFNPSPELCPRIAPAERGNAYEAGKVRELGLAFDGWTHDLIWGRVHDGNAAYALGGVSGHAGLFGPAIDVVKWARAWLSEGGGWLRSVTIGAAIRSWSAHLEEDRGLGWRLYRPRPSDLPAGRTRSGGDLLSWGAFGHTGFTGTSVWIDPSLGIGIVLLANRVHPTVEPDRFSRIRTLFHNAVVAGLAE